MGRKPADHPSRCLRLEDWPPLHRRVWEKAFSTGGLFDAPGLASKWRPHSANKTRKGYGLWIDWLRNQSGTDLAVLEASRPEDLVTKDALLAYVECLRATSSSMTVYNHVQEVYDAERVMTPSAPEGHWNWLKNAVKNLRLEAHPSRNKLARLQTADKLEQLGLDLMAEAETAPYWTDPDGAQMTLLQRALAFRDGLALELLIRRPFRISKTVSFAFPAS